jgi:hypothetical protein
MLTEARLIDRAARLGSSTVPLMFTEARLIDDDDV